ncbi:hypothetical protein HL667_28425 [Bradyrhizobium sp. 83012]|uniref:Uncharacterized protein n=1 Tax=Bradyrhizobium aeschynomenes TaxID=2734909 RepID=A0ABX2CL72_9BRAD|nr:hypothetical protein [Bradyrhizobium aeschynomenes]NPU13735.1 hypothetical protein [Bradyrhizobium aeschynomenes]NPU68958.1 hypothetical protein [Bradyrhizobium aeschynomenes]NPV22594.1 hypothetical protein [Bradyrhizobium aeschynomenes]
MTEQAIWQTGGKTAFGAADALRIEVGSALGSEPVFFFKRVLKTDELIS